MVTACTTISKGTSMTLGINPYFKSLAVQIGKRVCVLGVLVSMGGEMDGFKM